MNSGNFRLLYALLRIEFREGTIGLDEFGRPDSLLCIRQIHERMSMLPPRWRQALARAVVGRFFDTDEIFYYQGKIMEHKFNAG